MANNVSLEIIKLMLQDFKDHSLSFDRKFLYLNMYFTSDLNET